MGRFRAQFDGATRATTTTTTPGAGARRVVRGGNGGGSAASARRFEALYRAHARPLLAYALRRAARPEDAADVVAETMLVAWRRLDDVPDGDEARLWLYGVARRVLSNSRRSVARRDRLGERLRQEVQRLADPDLAIGVTVRLDVRRALERLSAEDRELLQLTSWEGLSSPQIAAVLGVSPVAVRTRLRRARARLRQELARDGGPEPQPPGAGHVGDDERPLVRKTEDER